MDEQEASVRRTAIIALTVIVVAILVGLVAVAETTDRTLNSTVKGVLLGLVLIALLGGAVLVWGPRKRRENDDE